MGADGLRGGCDPRSEMDMLMTLTSVPRDFLPLLSFSVPVMDECVRRVRVSMLGVSTSQIYATVK